MAEKNKQNLVPRPPIVVVMGHIDHGKTTLLDFIRKTKVTEAEAGGITQHVGAYEVEVKDKEDKNRKITFLDTPGHEAFSKIRQRGAKIADIAILVVAADDGVKQQTEEALNVIKETNTSFVVAINKTDREAANPDKVKKELSERNVLVEEWGGKVPCVSISAKTGQGVDELLEMVLLLADLEDLKTNPEEPASGVIIESCIDPKRGIAATLIIQNGILKRGMCVNAKESVAPVRIFENFLGKQINEAPASSPVKIIGFNKLPEAGAEFHAFESKKGAEGAAMNCLEQKQKAKKAAQGGEPRPVAGREIAQPAAVPAEDAAEKTIIPLVIKTDAIGSKEAVSKLIEKLQTEQVSFNVLKNEVGDIAEDDIRLAASGKNSIVIGFNIKCADAVKALAERYDATIKLFNIVYELEDWLKEQMEKRKPAEKKEEITGKLKVLKTFGDEKNKKIIGGEIIEGKISTGNYVKILRRDFPLGSGRILEMRVFKNKVAEGSAGEQVGLLIQTKNDIAPRDILEARENPIQS